MGKEVKIRYSEEEFEEIKKKAEKLGKTTRDYQLDVSKDAEVKIEVNNGK